MFLSPKTITGIVKILIVVVLLCNVPLPAQQYQRFEHLSFEDGVAHNLVHCILQDRQGYLWLGTMYGLVKYNAYSYIIYRNDPDNLNSLSNDDVTSLHEDRLGNIWAGTFGGGVNKYDRMTGRFIRYAPDPSDHNAITNGIVWTICEDHAGSLWFGTNGGGLNRFDLATQKFTHFMHDSTSSNSLSENIILSVVEDTSGDLWIGTKSNGVDRLDHERATFTHFRNQPDNPSSLSSNNIKKLYVDRDKNLWVCTYHGGLNKFVRAKGQFLHNFNEYSNPNGAKITDVNTIIQDTSGIFWIGTPYGLIRFDPAKVEYSHFYHTPLDENSLSNNDVVDLFEDRSGLLWIGTFHGGVDKLFTGKRRFSHFKHIPDDSTSLSENTVHAIFEDRGGVLWIGTDEGLDKFDDSKGTFHHYSWGRKAKSGMAVHAIAEDHSGNLWIGTEQGLIQLDKDGKKSKWYRHEPFNPNSLCNDAITCIHAGAKHNEEMWIGTPDGLEQFNPSTGIFVHHTHIESDPMSLSHNSVFSIYEDHSGVLWIGTFGGLNMYDQTKNRFTHFSQNPKDPQSLSNNYCLSMLEDRSGRLWVGTGGGLNRLDRTSGTFTHFMRKNGLPHNVICGIVEGQQGDLWFSTFGGLSRFNIKTEKFMNFDVSDGLQSNMFKEGAFCKRKNGTICFGGINGFNVVAIDSIPHNRFVPPVVIASFMLFDNTNKDFLATHPGVSLIELSYKENFFALAFSSLDYTQPEKNQYAFKLEGFDKDWVYSGNRRFARYMNLDPGEYIFKVKGSNNDSLWNETGTELRIMITPPFWKTWWFYSISVMAVFVLSLSFYNYRVKEKVNRLTELERVRSAENKRVRQRAADDFHDEFGHKLTKISLLSQVIRRTMADGSREAGEYLDKITQTSNELSMGMRDFLWTLNPDKDSVYDVAIRLKDFGDELFNNSQIAFRVHGITKELEQIQLSADWRRHLTLMFKEAMNNVVKHSECENVTLSISHQHGNLEVSLTDDGKGFNVNNGFSGQGLYSMRNRAEKICGGLIIESTTGTGTVVRFNSGPKKSPMLNTEG
jgi:ligand-binding sensor domain-containing protein/signal transduction histidine kinase